MVRSRLKWETAVRFSSSISAFRDGPCRRLRGPEYSEESWGALSTASQNRPSGSSGPGVHMRFWPSAPGFALGTPHARRILRPLAVGRLLVVRSDRGLQLEQATSAVLSLLGPRNPEPFDPIVAWLIEFLPDPGRREPPWWQGAAGRRHLGGPPSVDRCPKTAGSLRPSTRERAAGQRPRTRPGHQRRGSGRKPSSDSGDPEPAGASGSPGRGDSPADRALDHNRRSRDTGAGCSARTEPGRLRLEGLTRRKTRAAAGVSG